jgi:hypothetical protein
VWFDEKLIEVSEEHPAPIIRGKDEEKKATRKNKAEMRSLDVTLRQYVPPKRP